MLADDQLFEGGNPRPGFGTENFFVVLFGEPSATEPWGFQLDGHHLGLKLSMHGDERTKARVSKNEVRLARRNDQWRRNILLDSRPNAID